MNPIKHVQTVVALVAAVWLFCIGLVCGTKNVRNNPPTTAASTTQPQINITVPSTNMPVQSQPQTSNWYDIPSTTQPTTQPTTQDVQSSTDVQQSQTETTTQSAELSKEEIIAVYVNAVNKVKNMGSYTITREDTLNLFLDDITGGETVRKIANEFVASQAPHTVETRVFENGVDLNGSQETPYTAIPPLKADAAAAANGISRASAVPNAYGGYTINLALVDEVQTLDTPAPTHSTLVEVIDMASIGLPSIVQANHLNIYYSGCTISAETDAEGRIVTMTHFLPVTTADGQGQALGIVVDVKLHGDFTCIYSFTY